VFKYVRGIAIVTRVTSSDARELLLLAGERLIAERGIDVPLREVAVAAGQRNNSAVHYYFGSRDGLVEAIIERRQAPLEQRRMSLLAEHESSGGDDDIAVLVEILVRPMFDIPYADGSTHYARFLERVRTHPAVTRSQTGAAGWPTLRILIARLKRSLHHLPPAMRERRLSAMASAMFAWLADHEGRVIGHRSADAAQHAESEADIIAMIVGMLTAQPARCRAE